MEKEMLQARKYMYVRLSFAKTKIVLGLFTMVCAVFMALEVVGLSPVKFADTSALSEGECIGILIGCIVVFLTGIYFLISRIMWLVKYLPESKSIEEFIISDAECQNYLEKITSGNIMKRIGRSICFIEVVVEFIACIAGLLVAYICLIFYVVGRMFLIKLGVITPKNGVEGKFLNLVGGVSSSPSEEWQYCFDVGGSKCVYVDKNGKFFDDNKRDLYLTLRGYDVYNDNGEKVGDVTGSRLTITDSEIWNKIV